MWEISEGGTKLLYVKGLVSSKDLRFQESNVSKCWKLSIQVLFKFLRLGDASRIECCRLKTRQRRLFEFTKTNYALYKHLRAHTNFLERYRYEHVFIKLISFSTNFSPR